MHLGDEDQRDFKDYSLLLMLWPIDIQRHVWNTRAAMWCQLLTTTATHQYPVAVVLSAVLPQGDHLSHSLTQGYADDGAPSAAVTERVEVWATKTMRGRRWRRDTIASRRGHRGMWSISLPLFDGLVQDCGRSSALAMDIPQSYDVDTSCHRDMCIFSSKVCTNSMA